jgi:hypothetical protein
MIQINLLPDVKKEHLKAVRQKRTIISAAFIISGVFLGIVVLLAVAVFGIQKQTIASLSGDIDQDVATLKSTPDLDKILTIQNQLTALPGLHDSRPAATNLFDYLSIITPQEVKLASTKVSFVSGETANMEISGSTDTFKDANRFVDIIKNATYEYQDPATGEKKTGPAFSNVVLKTISKSDSQNSASQTSFTVVFAYDPEIFNIKNQDIKLTVPSITSSVSSTERPSVNTQPFDTGGQE